jgi:methyl-accepting chemotaxis protein
MPKKTSETTVNELAVIMAKSFTLQQKSIDDLARQMQEGFSRHQKIIDDLARQMQEGFSRHQKQIDDLARQMQEGFANTQKQIDDLVQNMHEITKGMDLGFSRVDGRFEQLIKTQEQRFRPIEQDIATIKSKFDSENWSY